MLKKKNILKISKVAVSFMLILSMFFSSSNIALAQFNIGSMISGAGNLVGGMNIQGVGGVALQCVSNSIGGVGNAFSGLFGNDAGDAVSGATETVGQVSETAENAQPIIEGVEGVASGATSVPVNDSQSIGIQNVIKSNTTVIKTEEKKQTRKEECLDKIARFAAVTVMDKITFATLDWINSGFEGKPFYLENPSQFFTDLATKELLGFSATFSGDSNLFPFGETLARSILVSFQRTFQQNMINSLNAVLAHGTRAEWEYNFSVGGWAGYTAFIEPNNNIFGAYIESSQNLQRRLQGTRMSTAINFQHELQQGLGFLSQRSCAQTQNSSGAYIPENSIQHITVGVGQITEINQIPTNVLQYITACGEFGYIFDEDGDGSGEESDGLCESDDEVIIAIAEEFRARSICTNWRTLTPGNQISQSLTKSLNSSQDQLMMVDELNENLGLILDALLLQLINQGVASFTEDNQNNVLAIHLNGGDPGASGNTVNFIDSMNGFSSGNTGDFAGFIPLQSEYIEKVTTLLDLYDDVIQKTYDLDYCVPGPNPGWYNTSANVLYNYFQDYFGYENYPFNVDFSPTLNPGQQQQNMQAIQQNTQLWITLTPQVFHPLVLGNIPQTAIFSNFNFNNTLNKIYGEILKYFTGLEFEPNNLSSSSQIISKTSLLNHLNSAFVQYANRIGSRYTNDLTGNVRQRARDFFLELPNLNQMKVAYQTSVTEVQNTLPQLIALRDQYAQIERNYIVQQLQVAVNEQGLTQFTAFLNQFTGFTNAQVTYIGNGTNLSTYNQAVNNLTAQWGGGSLTPPPSYPGMTSINSQLQVLLPDLATPEYIQIVDQEITSAITKIGNIGDFTSLDGLINSCVVQVSTLPVANNTRLNPILYPFPYTPSPAVASLPFGVSFLPDITFSPNVGTNINISLSVNNISWPQNLAIFESRFINIGQALY